MTVLYLSHKLLPREARYSTVEKEGLAIKWALESLRYYLLGREFNLGTDHRVLTWMNSMKNNHSRLTCWYLSLQPFQFQIRHRADKTNAVVDYLSRLLHITNLGEEGDNVMECRGTLCHSLTGTHLLHSTPLSTGAGECAATIVPAEPRSG